MVFLEDKNFGKQVSKILDHNLLDMIVDSIGNVIKATNKSEIKNLKKMKGHKIAYRIKIGTYRIGVFIENENVTFSKIAHRKDIYKNFP